ncbi:MAG: CARDB domain-containing protein, partial [Thermoplasmata archaeon]
NDVEVDDFPANAMHDYPVLAVDDSENIYVAWRDTRNGFSDQDIYFTESEDGGITFGDGIKNDNDIKVNDALYDTDQELPSMALTPDGSVCIVWYDNRNFDHKRVDIYFSIFLGAVPDLIITGGSVDDITFDPQSPQVEGTNVTINATIHNIGTENATNVVVRFYDGSLDPLDQIGGDQTIPFLLSGGDASVSMQWMCQGAGIHSIFVSVDPDDEIIEWNETNNVASKTFIVLPIENPARPEDVSAALFGLAQTGVIITWTLSLDDNAGRNTVESYDVYRGLDYDSGGSGYMLMGSVPNGMSNFMDLTGGWGDTNDYFYLVCAFNSTLGSSCSLTQGAKTNLEVTSGWNLVSFPLLLWSADLEAAFRTIDFDIVRRYDARSSSWSSFFSSKDYSPLRSVDVSSGFWVHFPGSGNLTIAGQVPRQIELELRAGWNLIALPSFASDLLFSDLAFMFPLKRAETFDATSPPHFLREMGSLDVFDPKRGYWVQSLEDVTILISN